MPYRYNPFIKQLDYHNFTDQEARELLADCSAIVNIPIGSIIAWAKSMTGTPALEANFVECNGQVLADSGSPYNGQTIYNLNGASGGTKRFLRGSTTSGAVGGSETHTHTTPCADTSWAIANSCCCGCGSGAAYTPYLILPPPNAYHKHSISSASTGATSTLPSWYEVVWIMRIK